MDKALIPIACSLPLRDAATQVLEWRELNARLTSSEKLGRGWRVTYPIDLADQVEDLAARESACCGWLTLRTTRTENAILLEMESDHPDAGPVLELLATTG